MTTTRVLIDGGIAIVTVILSMYPVARSAKSVAEKRALLRLMWLAVIALAIFFGGMLLCPQRFQWLVWIAFGVALAAVLLESRRIYAGARAPNDRDG